MHGLQMLFCRPSDVCGGGEQACFSFGTGPLAWSIIAFRNSLVFHSLDKVLPAGACAPNLERVPSSPVAHRLTIGSRVS